MDLEKLKPWNWFKHEEGGNGGQVPVRRDRGETRNVGGAGSLLRLHDEMDRWFDDAFKSFGMPSMATRSERLGRIEGPLQEFFRPQIDVAGDANGYQVSLDVPGLDESDLSLEVKDDLLLIKGQKEERSEDKDRHYYRMERSYGSFQRTLSLPDDADTAEISANLEKGVLKIEIPRRAAVAEDVKRISISA